MVWAVLILVTLAAGALRLPFLGHQSLWFDEIYTRDIVGEPTVSALWHQVRATESTPPLYYLIAWLLGGRSAAAMRAIPAVALTLAAPVSYLALRRAIGQRAALASAAIVAVTPVLVSYATDARAYGLLVLTSLLSVWGFSGLLERESRRRYASWALACIACVWTHYFGFFIVAAEALILIAMRPRSRLRTLGWSAVIALCLAPLLPLVSAQSGDERAAFITGMPLGSRLVQTVRQFAMGPNVPRTWLEAVGLVFACGGVAAGLFLTVRAGRRARALLALALLTFGAPLVLALTGIEDRFYARNVIEVLPVVAGLAAPALLRFRAVPLVAYLVIAAVVSLWVASNWRYEAPDWRGVIARAKRIDPSAALVPVTVLSTRVVRTYLGRPPASGGVRTRRVWVAVEPVRTAGHRELGPAPAPPLPGFRPVRDLVFHGFRLILETAPRPTTVTVPGASVFPGGP